MVGVGVLLNPIAGFGGALAMHGTDGLAASRFDEAMRGGHAERRLIHALERFLAAGIGPELVAAPGVLGAMQLGAAGIPHRALSHATPARTTRHDTMVCARMLVAEGVGVLVFAGGDGTATDIAAAVGLGVPVIGVPSGVKMHSEVFARSPESAGRLLADFVRDDASCEMAEVLDVGRDGRVGAVAMMLVPRSRGALQGAKSSSSSPASGFASRAIAERIVSDASADVTWVVGPGRTAGAVGDALGFTGTLRGIDVRHPAGGIEQDVTEERLHEIVQAAVNPRLVLGVVGGQGFLLGRGNQQLSKRVIDRLGAERIDIVATAEKLGGLFPPHLFVDAEGSESLVGYREVRTGAHQSTVMKVVDAAA